MHEINVSDFQIKDSFFSPYQKLIREVVIPYQRDVFENKVPGVEKSSVIENFRLAAGLSEGEFYGMVFQDSDLGKWLEAAAYSLMMKRDEALEADCDALIDLIGMCQQEDGYLNTYFTVKEPEHRFENLQECHELYCAGHLIEGAVAYYQATGKDKFLKIMCRMADLLCDTFGADKQRGVPGHPEIELALMRLYDVTGEEKYRELCSYFVHERGKAPDFFKEEADKRGWTHFGMNPDDKDYAQMQAPVMEQTEAVGHAVRAVYLYTGMAMLASESKDEALLNALRRLYRNIVDKKLYITGAIGATVDGEAFSVDYELPNDTVYGETCASVGLIFFMKAMLGVEKLGEYADVMERTLYNCVLAGMELDGKRFFYVNPLEVNPELSGKKFGFRHVLPQRPGWFGCACCPPNVARLLASLSKYAFDYDEDTIYEHLYIGGEAKIDGVAFCVSGDYLKNGVMTLSVTEASKAKQLALHIPGWCDHYKMTRNSVPAKYHVKDGYAYLEEPLKAGDTIEISFEMKPEKYYANAMVREDANAVAIMRGPMCYCFEGVDHSVPLERLRIAKDGDIRELPFDETLLSGILPLEVEGYEVAETSALYAKQPPSVKPVLLRAIPYYTWANRGLNQMRVWMPWQ